MAISEAKKTSLGAEINLFPKAQQAIIDSVITQINNISDGDDVTIPGDLTVTGATTLNGTLTLGDEAADALTVNATTTYEEVINYSNETGITANAGGGQGSAVALTEEINNVTTCATAGDSVKLKSAVAGAHQYIKNSGATALDIFPATGDSINALAVNLAIRIQPGSSIDLYAKDATVWESTNDTSITIPAPTTLKGGLEIKSADSAGNTITTVTNASQTAAWTYTIPDAGDHANFIMSKGAQTISGVTTFGSASIYSTTFNVAAFAGGGQANATALTDEYNNVLTCATAHDSVKLPKAVTGQTIYVKNSGAALLDIFPVGNGSDRIDGVASDLAVSLAPQATARFIATTSATWESSIDTSLTLNAPTTALGQLTVKASDNAADHDLVVTNASHGQDTTYTIPDAGADANFLLDKGDITTGITAFATGGQASATALTTGKNNVTTCATAHDSVKLPAAVAGLVVYVKNSGATALDIFPASSDSIDAMAADLAVTIQPNSSAKFTAIDGTVWESNVDTSITLNSPSTVSGQLEIKAADSAGDTVTTITNASQAAARTYTVPDAGASANFVLSEGNATINGNKTFGGEINANTDGDVNDPIVKIGSSDALGFYEVSGTQLGISVGDTLVGMFDSNGLVTTTITEQVVSSGVEMASVLVLGDSSYGRMSTSTAAGAAIDIDSGASRGEGLELRYNVSDYTNIPQVDFDALGDAKMFQGAYIRSEAGVDGVDTGAVGVVGWGVANAVGAERIEGVRAWAYAKGDTTDSLDYAWGVRGEFSMDAGRANTLTLTEAAGVASRVTSGKVDDYTKIHGFVSRFGDMDGGSRTYGAGIKFLDGPESGTSALTNVLETDMAATAFYKVSADGVGGVTLGSTMTISPEATAESGYITMYVNSTAYQIPIYAA